MRRALAVLAVALALPASASARPLFGFNDERAVWRAVGEQATLLTFHGGGFVEGDPVIEDVEAAAATRGFKVVRVDYQLGNLRAAVRDARRAASRHPKAVAYGESAGGTLAVLLAQRGLVDRAVGWLAPVDLRRTFSNPLLAEYAQRLGASRRDLKWASPVNHETRNPVFVQIGRDDLLVNAKQQRRWARDEPLVRARTYAANHVWPPEPSVRERQVAQALRWLKEGR